MSLDEPVFLTKYRLSVVLPAPLRNKYGSELITEQILSIGGLDLNKVPEPIEQYFRSHKRRFAGSVIETNVDVEMEFEVNVDDKTLQMYPFNIMRDWCKILYDPMSAFQGLKKDYTGSATIEMHRKDGKVLRKAYFPLFFPIEPINPMDLNYTEEGNYKMTMKFAGENFSDLSYL